ncbi:MAG: DUF692 domain-containing protein [Pseudomonadota bacterium]
MEPAMPCRISATVQPITGPAGLQGVSAGTGLKPEHAPDIFGDDQCVDFFEIHAENYMGAGGPPHHLLRRIRESYPVSIHGVGLSIGGAEPLDRDHLVRLKTLIARYEPFAFSEHLAWSSHNGVFMNDLLPLPYNIETLARVAEHIHQVQDATGSRMLLENPSTYVAFAHSDICETDFLREIAERTGCGLLLDVNNVYVSTINQGIVPDDYIDAFPMEYVGEIHLGGFSEDADDFGARLLIDSHGAETADAVWDLYRYTLGRSGPIPTLVEWDNNVPEFKAVAAQVARARAALAIEARRRNRCYAA